jgi:small-conductance mechanosensitive channel
MLEQYYEYAYAAAIVLAALVLSRVAKFILDRIAARAARLTKTTLDDEIIAALKRPVPLVVVVAGTYVALKQIAALRQYATAIDLIYNVILILIAASIASNVFQIVLAWYLRGVAPKAQAAADKQFMPIIRTLSFIFIYGAALIIILGQLGQEIGPLIAGLGVAGLAVALALQDTLANFFAGFYILADKPIKAGDFVQLAEGQEGYVQEIGWRSTKIRTLTSNLIIIPNAKLAQSIVTNYSLPAEKTGVVIPVSVAYGSDVEKVERVLLDVAKRVVRASPVAAKDFEPQARFSSFGESSLDFKVILQAEHFVKQYELATQFRKELLRRFRKERIEIPFPVRTVYLKKS